MIIQKIDTIEKADQYEGGLRAGMCVYPDGPSEFAVIVSGLSSARVHFTRAGDTPLRVERGHYHRYAYWRGDPDQLVYFVESLSTNTYTTMLIDPRTGIQTVVIGDKSDFQYLMAAWPAQQKKCCYGDRRIFSHATNELCGVFSGVHLDEDQVLTGEVGTRGSSWVVMEFPDYTVRSIAISGDGLTAAAVLEDTSEGVSHNIHLTQWDLQ